MKKLIKISEKELSEAGRDTWDYLFLLISKYYETIEVDPTVENDFSSNAYYTALVAYDVLLEEVFKGGFLELIYNGYGEFIFDACFSEVLRSWGAVKIASNVEKARGFYLKTTVRGLKEQIDGMTLRSEFSELNLIDNEFFQIVSDETEKIKLYIQNNFNEFAIVV